ncbi:hypothetical protein RSAG8_11168, partial [Rhizoctonia solani AG-8 WAC10335]
MDAILPPLPPDELTSTFKTLLASNHIQYPYTDNPRWTCLPRDPRTSKQPEHKTFKFLEEITKAIEESHLLESQEWVTLSITGKVTPVGFRHNTSRPGGFIHFEHPSSVPVEWANIILAMEFKNKYDKNKNIDAMAKVIWSMHHIMRNDARRRHVYGLTCENTKARLWYGDRSDLVVSTEFDVNKDWKYLVRIILSMLLASPSQLGFDPTIEACSPNNGNSEPSYVITVHKSDTAATQYKTVQKLVDGVFAGPFYALKDVWVREDRTPEHQVLLQIRKDQPQYSQHFLTPLDYGYVPHDVANPSIPDNTHRTLRHWKLEPTGTVLYTQSLPRIRPTTSQSQSTGSVSRDTIGYSETIPNSPWRAVHGRTYLSKNPRQHYRMVVEEVGEPVYNLRNFTDIFTNSETIPNSPWRAVHGRTYLSKNPRQHYRMVVEEVGEPVYNLCNFPDIFTAIHGGWEGLHAIHENRQVHRDVSGGNILLVPASGTLGQRGVIMDLEYAKEIDDTSAPRDGRTGTAAFMATEVACVEHYRLTTVHEELERNSLPLNREQRMQKRLEELQKQVEPPRPDLNSAATSASVFLPPFHHNPLHDMESIWWLCIWMIFRLVPSNVSGKQHIENYQKVFFDHWTKREFLCGSRKFLSLTTHLSGVQSFIPIMSMWRVQLNELYYDSYKAQNALPGPLTRIRIDETTLQLGYKSGKAPLEFLKTASMKISIDFVTLSK